MLFSVFMLALRSVQRNLLRSFLTVLGIVIGVSAVITMVRSVSPTACSTYRVARPEGTPASMRRAPFALERRQRVEARFFANGAVRLQGELVFADPDPSSVEAAFVGPRLQAKSQWWR